MIMKQQNSLTELLIVVIILGVLAAIVIPQFSEGADLSQPPLERVKNQLPHELRGMIQVTADKVTVQGEVTKEGLEGSLTAFLAAQKNQMKLEHEKQRMRLYLAGCILVNMILALWLVRVYSQLKMSLSASASGIDIRVEGKKG